MPTKKQPLATTDELPPIGSPARNALAAIGVTKLSQVVRMSEAELLAVHGVGPKAVRLLRAVMEPRGLSFRE